MGHRQLAGMDLEASRRLKLHFVEEWQRRWDRAVEGRTTYAFIPNVRRRLQCKWLAADYWTTQFLTGHGDFASYLHKRSLWDSLLCDYGGIDTPWHIFMDCPNYDRLRSILRTAVITAQQMWPPTSDTFLHTDTFPAFKNFCRSAVPVVHEPALI